MGLNVLNKKVWKSQSAISAILRICSFDRNKIEDLILRFIHNKYDVVNTILTLDA